MKKMMILLLAAGICSVTAIPARTNAQNMQETPKQDKRDKKELKKEEKREKKEQREQRKMENGMTPYSYSYNYNYNMMRPPAALPVTENFVPADVMASFRNKYGPSLYDITTLNLDNGSNAYVVRMIENGVAQSITVDASGSPVVITP
ncbi:hypothetical protein ACDQ55_18985 [Chitinophaga sp. 30R24]|uniref:hypothetical protein n=1 Tax=Chitinophaga sp. 30R24 TaxID=3248838 RepID=UPI003B8FF133